MMYFKWYGLIYTACAIYMMSFAIGIGCAGFPWLPETLPPVGVGFSWFWQWMFCASVGYFSPILIEQIGVLSLSIIFTSICFIGGFVLDYVCVETKGKSPVIVADEYLNRKWKPFNFF